VSFICRVVIGHFDAQAACAGRRAAATAALDADKKQLNLSVQGGLRRTHEEREFERAVRERVRSFAAGGGDVVRGPEAVKGGDW
jgi:hypothetical protein